MKIGDIIDIRPSMLRAAFVEACRTVPFLSAHGRTSDEILRHTLCGLLAEMGYNILNGSIDWWVHHRRQISGCRDDGGRDSPDNVNVKCVLPGQRRVYVKRNDSRASKYVVFLLNMEKNQLQVLGQFEHESVHSLPGRRAGDGVFLEELKEIT